MFDLINVDTLKLAYLKGKFVSSKRKLFYTQIHALLVAGVSLYDALDLMEQALEENKGVFASFTFERQILSTIRSRMDLGLGSQGVAVLFEGLIPEGELTILSVDARRLSQALMLCIKRIKRFAELKKTIYKNSATPIGCFLVVVGLIAVINHYIFPTLLGVFELSALPGITRSLYAFCHFFEANFTLTLIAALLLVVAIIVASPRLTGVIRTVLDYLPPFNIIKSLTATSCLFSLSLLLDSGDDFVSAVEKLEENSNRYTKQYLVRIKEGIFDGFGCGASIAGSNLLSRASRVFIQVLDRAGVLESALSQMAEHTMEIQLNHINRTMSLLSKVLMGAVFAFMLWFYFALGQLGLSVNVSNQTNQTTTGVISHETH